MGTSDAELYRKPSPSQLQQSSNRRLAPWHKMTPLIWAPFMYTSRFWLKGRVTPANQHKIFAGLTLVALSHAGYVMRGDSTMGGGNM